MYLFLVLVGGIIPAYLMYRCCKNSDPLWMNLTNWKYETDFSSDIEMNNYYSKLTKNQNTSQEHKDDELSLPILSTEIEQKNKLNLSVDTSLANREMSASDSSESSESSDGTDGTDGPSHENNSEYSEDDELD